MADVDPVAAERRLRAKRQNERVKLLASFLNTLSLAVVGAAFVVPGVTSLATVRWSWLPAALLLHIGAHVAFGWLTSEDWGDVERGLVQLGLPVVALAFGGFSLFLGWLGHRDFRWRYPDSPK